MPEPFVRLAGPAVYLPASNIDTDQIVPARFMRTPRSEGYADFLFHDLRFDGEGQPIDGFPLNAPGAGDAKILIAGDNFGCGSSREAAVYALVDFGIRCVIAPGFGDIFRANGSRNGLLTVTLPASGIDRLLEAMAGADIEVDLQAQTVRCGGLCMTFSIDGFARESLLTGLDEIDLTLRRRDDLERFAASHLVRYPWLAFVLEPPADRRTS